MKARQKVDPGDWATSHPAGRPRGKIRGNPEVAEWVKAVMEKKAAGESHVSYLQIAAQLSDPDTDPYCQITEAGVRHHVRNHLRDLYRAVHGHY